MWLFNSLPRVPFLSIFSYGSISRDEASFLRHLTLTLSSSLLPLDVTSLLRLDSVQNILCIGLYSNWEIIHYSLMQQILTNCPWVKLCTTCWVDKETHRLCVQSSTTRAIRRPAAEALRKPRRQRSDPSCRKKAIRKGILGLHFERWVDIFIPWSNGMG